MNTRSTLERPVTETQALPASSWRPIYWGVVVGILQALSPLVIRWLDQDLVWAIGLMIIGPIYIGLAVADGRTRVIAIEIAVASGFILIALVGISASPWLVVVGLVGHGLKDLWQHRTHFVANTRWWPPFCLVVDFVAAALIAVFVLTGVDLNG